jgi:hypothetical protein
MSSSFFHNDIFGYSIRVISAEDYNGVHTYTWDLSLEQVE